MTPDDWYNTVKACLTMGQYLDWKSIFQDLCAVQARQNIAQGHPQWSLDMLIGPRTAGRFMATGTTRVRTKIPRTMHHIHSISEFYCSR